MASKQSTVCSSFLLIVDLQQSKTCVSDMDWIHAMTATVAAPVSGEMADFYGEARFFLVWPANGGEWWQGHADCMLLDHVVFPSSSRGQWQRRFAERDATRVQTHMSDDACAGRTPYRLWSGRRAQVCLA